MKNPPPYPIPISTARVQPKKKTQDPYLYVLVWQTALCAVLLLCAVVIRQWLPGVWEQVKAKGEPLLIWDEGMSWDALEKNFQETFQRVLNQFPGNPVTLSLAAVITPPSGMGGGGTPDNCTSAPVVLSSILYPPVSGSLTSPYGWREHPVTGNEDFHRGIDIAAPEGTAIHAVLPGVVTETGQSTIYGNYIRLDHGRGLETAYSHCAAITVQEGENLRRGELLGTVGNTGVSTGPHVHFEFLVKGNYYNPAWVMEGLTAPDT